MKRAAAALISLGVIGFAWTGTGCAPDRQHTPVRDDPAVSSVAEITHPDVADAVEIRIDGRKDDEVFILEYNWYGEEFISEDSLNKTMYANYALETQHAPQASQGSVLSFVFDSSEPMPTVIKATQYGNTPRANSGLPSDALGLELLKEGENGYSFALDYRNFRMYYYQLECEWENGNSLKIAFAVEKPEE